MVRNRKESLNEGIGGRVRRWKVRGKGQIEGGQERTRIERRETGEWEEGRQRRRE